MTELARFTQTEPLTAWAGKILPHKNQLTTSDAEALEIAFVAKLSDVASDAAENVEVSKQSESANDKLNYEEDLQRHAKNGSPTDRYEMAEQSVTPIGKTLRLRDRDHLKFVSTQPCLTCGRSPSDAHHLKFAQGRARGERRIYCAALPCPSSRTASAR